MVAHLPPAVKHLLTLRNPNSFPGPPVAKLNDVLARTFRDAQQKKAEKGWLTLAVRLFAPRTCCRAHQGRIDIDSPHVLFSDPISLSIYHRHARS